MDSHIAVLIIEISILVFFLVFYFNYVFKSLVKIMWS